jgi:hypothetical protein
VYLPAESFGVSCTVKVKGKDFEAIQRPSTGESRQQPDLAPRFVLAPGNYNIIVIAAGKAIEKAIVVADQPLKVRFDEKPAPPKK